MDLSTLVMLPILENNKDQTIDSIPNMVSSTAYCYMTATIGNQCPQYDDEYRGSDVDVQLVVYLTSVHILSCME